ncbi:hypothetical protein SLE2022_245430 [Rubroshorea leprosula]
MEEDEVLELFEIQYSDLKLLSSPPSCSHLEKMIIENLGPTGPGLLAVTGVPNASLLRQKLLPLARKLALLSPDDRKRILKEHNLGSDVPLKNPERNVSSFAMQLRYAQGLKSIEIKPNCEERAQDSSLSLDNLDDDMKGEFKNVGAVFKELGSCMMELGLCFARICDWAIGGHELEQSLLESCSAKGRLIHYHSTPDSLVLKQAGRKKGSAKKRANNKIVGGKKQSEGGHLDENGDEAGSCGIHSNLWQQWHHDYGIFTVLTDPMFLSASYLRETTADDEYLVSSSEECSSPGGHSYLQIYDPNKNKVLMVKSSPESFIVQVGESADILSKGRLRSTLHCVRRPSKLESLSRETFVVFLQPAWSKTFSVSDCHMDHGGFGHQKLNESEENGLSNQEGNTLSQEIQKIVPPLSARLKDGMTFAEFSRGTTKQYYGRSGLQSNR